MHCGVGDLAVAFFFRVFWVAATKGHVALQGAAVVGQLLESTHRFDFTCGGNDALANLRHLVIAMLKVKAQVAVVHKACRLHGLVVSDDFGA